MKIGFLFDLDGTLLNTLEDLKDATNHVLKAWGYPERTLEQIRTVVGNGAENQIRKSLPGSVDNHTVHVLLKAYKEYYDTHCQIKTAPYAGILNALQKLKDYPVAIVSNKPDSAVKTLCAQYFGDIYALGESPDCPRKPDPAMVRKGMEAIGVDQCIYVGDSEVDILTAKNAGVPCLSVLWGFRDLDMLVRNGGVHFCGSVEAMPDLLIKMAEELQNGQ